MTLEQAKMSGQSEGAGLLVITGIKTVQEVKLQFGRKKKKKAEDKQERGNTVKGGYLCFAFFPPISWREGDVRHIEKRDTMLTVGIHMGRSPMGGLPMERQSTYTLYLPSPVPHPGWDTSDCLFYYLFGLFRPLPIWQPTITKLFTTHGYISTLYPLRQGSYSLFPLPLLQGVKIC